MAKYKIILVVIYTTTESK